MVKEYFIKNIFHINLFLEEEKERKREKVFLEKSIFRK